MNTSFIFAKSCVPLAALLGFAFAAIAAADGNEPVCHATAARVDWTMLPSTYTHDQTGRRVQQFALGVQPTVVERPDYQRSGYRHYRSSLQGGNSSDHIHIVDQWGPPVRPYGEWRYPYRPFSVPYPAWGPMLPAVSSFGQFNFQNQPIPHGAHNPGMNINGAGVNGNWGNPAWNGPGTIPGAYPGQGPFSGFTPNGTGLYGVGPQNVLRPEQDEYYPPAPEPPQMPDRDFFFVPGR